MPKSPQQKVLQKLRDASEWSFVERLLLEDEEAVKLAKQDQTCQAIQVLSGVKEVDVRQPLGRALIVEKTRALVNQSVISKADNGDKPKLNVAHLKSNYNVGMVKLKVRGIYHNVEGIAKAGSEIGRSELVVLEPGLLYQQTRPGVFVRTYFSEAKSVVAMPRSEEMKYARFSERLLSGLKVKLASKGLVFGKSYKTVTTFKTLTNEQRRRATIVLDLPLPHELQRTRAAYIVKNDDPITALYSASSLDGIFTDFTASVSRSLGQGEFALAEARQRNLKSVDLVVGAAHAKEMDFIYGLPGMREEFLRQRTTWKTTLPYTLEKVPFAVKVASAAGLMALVYSSC